MLGGTIGNLLGAVGGGRAAAPGPASARAPADLPIVLHVYGADAPLTEGKTDGTFVVAWLCDEAGHAVGHPVRWPRRAGLSPCWNSARAIALAPKSRSLRLELWEVGEGGARTLVAGPAVLPLDALPCEPTRLPLRVVESGHGESLGDRGRRLSTGLSTGLRRLSGIGGAAPMEGGRPPPKGTASPRGGGPPKLIARKSSALILMRQERKASLMLSVKQLLPHAPPQRKQVVHPPRAPSPHGMASS
jgi:hypothetical protein